MNVLVTGGAGFIGSHLIDALLKNGEKVIAIDDFNDFYAPSLKRENISLFLDNKNFKLYVLDIRDGEGVRNVIEKESIASVVHLAARAGVRPSIENPILYEETNSIGTMNVLEAIKNLKIKNFVFASSSSVYGINSKLPFSEDDPITKPISPYASTKRGGELMCYTYSYLYNIPVTCLRFFTVYGERGRPDMSIARFTRMIWESTEAPIYGDGSARRDFTYIGDILKGLISAVYKPFSYEIINLGESRTVTVLEVVSIIEEKLGKKAKLKFLPPAAGDVPITYADISKAKKLLAYAPDTPIEKGIERYVKWFLKREERIKA